MEEKIIERAEYLEVTQMSGREEPEIGINEETSMITINRYNPESACSYFMEEFCDVIEVDIEKLRMMLAKTHIAYVF